MVLGPVAFIGSGINAAGEDYSRVGSQPNGWEKTPSPSHPSTDNLQRAWMPAQKGNSSADRDHSAQMTYKSRPDSASVLCATARTLHSREPEEQPDLVRSIHG